MRLTNLTKISNKTIKAILKDLGIDKSNAYITVLIKPDLDTYGLCDLYEGDRFVISLLNDLDIPTLAHELKHVEQVVSGLRELIEAEIDLTEYDDQWHEIEACEYESKYKAA